VIVSWPTKQVVEFKPEGFVLPLKGRDFVYGIVDCYTLVQDYYFRELNIKLPDIKRPRNDWWKRGEDFYTENFKKAGFEVVAKLEKNCVLLIQVYADVPNHSGIYLGDGKILHHMEGRCSCEEVYGGYWEKHTRLILKYEGVHANDN